MSIQSLEKILNYRFRSRELAEGAIIHPSFGSSKFEVLEFVGDRVIAMIVTNAIWKMRPENEKIYAHHFVAATNKSALLKVGQSMGLAQVVQWKGCKSHQNTIISDACEAVFGAIYLDSNIEIAEEIFLRFWQPGLLQPLKSIDPKSYLYNWANAEGYEINYELLKQEGLPHQKKYTVSMTIGKFTIAGYGKSIKEAEKNAAQRFLEEKNIK